MAPAMTRKTRIGKYSRSRLAIGSARAAGSPQCGKASRRPPPPCHRYRADRAFRKAEGAHSLPQCGKAAGISAMAGVTGLEPATSGVTGRRSDQLSYTPAACGRGGHSNPPPPRCKRDALPAELIARRRRSGPAQPFSESRNPLPGLNLACRDAAILIFSPVRGLRPSEAAREATEKVPNPTRRTSSPLLSALVIDSNTASTALLASDFRNSVLLATASTSSFLFTGCPPESGGSEPRIS